MNKSEVLHSLQEIGLVPVLRADSVAKALAIAGAIADGGVTVLEITMTVPGAIEVIRKLAEQRPDILIGAGTVLDPETARMCILEGAKFVVSPALDLAFIEDVPPLLHRRSPRSPHPHGDRHCMAGRSRRRQSLPGKRDGRS